MKSKKLKVKRLSPEESAEAQQYLLDESTALAKVGDRPLSDDEKAICHNIVLEGFHHFDKIGWQPEREANFLSRPNVKRELDRQLALMQDGAAVMQRRQFFAKLHLMQMVPGALSVVQKTLVGVTDKMLANAKLMAKLPTTEQYRAAMDVLSMCGITTGNGSTNIQVNVMQEIIPQIDRRTVAGDEDDPKHKYDMESIGHRTTVRTAIDRILRVAMTADDDIKVAKQERAEHKIAKKRRKRMKERGFKPDTRSIYKDADPQTDGEND